MTTTVLSLIATAVAAVSSLVTFREKQRNAQQRRRDDITKALLIAEKVQTIDIPGAVGELTRGVAPQPVTKYIRELAYYRKYLDPIDTDCFQHISYLLSMIDQVERNSSSIGGNGAEIAQRLERLRDRLYCWPIHRWREELSDGKPFDPDQLNRRRFDFHRLFYP